MPRTAGLDKSWNGEQYFAGAQDYIDAIPASATMGESLAKEEMELGMAHVQKVAAQDLGPCAIVEVSAPALPQASVLRDIRQLHAGG